MCVNSAAACRAGSSSPRGQASFVSNVRCAKSSLCRRHCDRFHGAGESARGGVAKRVAKCPPHRHRRHKQAAKHSGPVIGKKLRSTPGQTGNPSSKAADRDRHGPVRSCDQGRSSVDHVFRGSQRRTTHGENDAGVPRGNNDAKNNPQRKTRADRDRDASGLQLTNNARDGAAIARDDQLSAPYRTTVRPAGTDANSPTRARDRRGASQAEGRLGGTTVSVSHDRA